MSPFPLSLGKVLVHVAVPPLQFVLVGGEPPLHGEAALGPRQLPRHEVVVVLHPRALVLRLLARLVPPVRHHPRRALLVPPRGVGHHLRQLPLLLLVTQRLLLDVGGL